MIQFISLVAIAFFWLATTSVIGQGPTSVKLKADLVVVTVAVEDEQGRPVMGLRKEDFVLYEELSCRERHPETMKNKHRLTDSLIGGTA
jgi:hypothetical protein